MNCPAAHHAKIEGEDRYAPRLRELADAWRLRMALRDIGRFKAKDPLPRDERREVLVKLIDARWSARAWLEKHRASSIRRLPRAVRHGFRLLAGGKS